MSEPAEISQADETASRTGGSLIVGLGASAGGLEALKALLGRLPPDPGFALVLVQHVGESENQLLADVLAGFTRLPVVPIVEGLAVAPDQLFVAPADAIVGLKGDRFRVRPPRTSSERRNPIDRFFNALAEAGGTRSVAIILSGSGSDGALGLGTISAAGGLTIAQTADTAAFSEMPSSAAAAADHVLPAAEIADTLLAYARHWRAVTGSNVERRRREVQARLPEICDILLRRTGHDFKHYKTSTLLRRIDRRMQVLQLAELDDYVAYLARDVHEPHILFRELLIGVTSFFREPDAFHALAERAIANVLRDRTSKDQVRIWVPGCATGEEAYSIAILVCEKLKLLADPPKVQIFATDVNERALVTARRGAYPQGIAGQISAERLGRYFVKRGRRYHVTEEVRDLCLFSAHNLISDPPFSRLDLISCRNLLIYLGSHLQKKLIPLFHYALRPGGYLFLGASESLTGHNELFRVIDAKHRLAQRKDTNIHVPGRFSNFASSGAPGWRSTAATTEADLGAVAQRILLDEFAPKYAIVSEEGQVIFLSEGADRYIQAPAGSFTNNIMRMVRRGLSVGLRTAFTQAVRNKRTVTRDIPSVHTAEGLQAVRITVQPMPELGREDGLYMLVFQDRGAQLRRSDEDPAHHPEADAVIEALERELLRTREDLERTVQDLEAANEELKSSNEELLSMNEELQSANEELETSKEEVQAANQALSSANADLENLLRSTRIATIFLDAEGAMRGFTPAATDIYNIVAGDVGRKLSDFTHRLNELQPMPTAAELQAASGLIEHEARTDDGRWFLRRVMSYRGPDAAIDGMLITFVEITNQKQAEAALQDSETKFRMIADTMPQLVWSTTAEGYHDYYNERWYDYTGMPREPGQGWNWKSFLHPDDYERTLQVWNQCLATGALYEIEYRFKEHATGEYRWFIGRASALRDARGQVLRWFGTCTDIEEQKRAEERQRLLMGELNHRVRNTLAVIQSVIRQTQKGSTSVAALVDTLQGRIQALARAHSLLSDAEWNGASLRTLVAGELELYQMGSGNNASIKGPEVLLNPSLAMLLSMAIHELATNAAKHGAFSRPEGRVDVSWGFEDRPEGPTFVLRWRETGGPPIEEQPTRRGFGSTLIERALVREAHGRAKLEFRREGVAYDLEIPKQEIELKLGLFGQARSAAE